MFSQRILSRLFGALFLSLILLQPTPESVAIGSATVSASKWQERDQPRWKSVDELVGKQQYQAALDEVKKIIKDSEKTQDIFTWTKALIRQALLEQGLHGYETAVRDFRAASWPKDPVAHALLKLFYANTLWTYYSGYSYEIGQRERVISKGEVDLKKWDQETIFAEIHKHYFQVWQNRELLSALSVKDFPELIIQQGYPDGIRSNFRDFVTYQWVGFLANTTTWTARESQETYLLHLSGLLQPKKNEKLNYLSEEIHPLTKISSLLNDLYFWHAGKKEHEAALETQLERVRTLASSFTTESEQQEIRDHLEKFLKSYRSYSWWAAGQYELAQLVHRSGDWVRAHELARQGALAYPKSLGGQRCLHLQKSIEAPDFSVQSMSLDRNQTRSFQISHKNFSKLYFRAYRLDFFESFERRGWDIFNTYSNWTRDVVHKSRPTKRWTVDLAATPDFKMHQTYVTPALEENAFYVIAASVHQDFRLSDNKIVAFHFLTSPLILASDRTIDGGMEYFVREGQSGKAASRAVLDFYQIDPKNHAHKVRSLDTDERGYRKVAANELGSHGNYFCVARKGKIFSFDPQSVSLYPQSVNPQVSGVLVYTDRSIYRPLQKIFYKVVSYHGDRIKGNYQVGANATLRVSFRDPNQQEIAFQDVVTNAFGSASGEFLIPTGKILGGYQILAGNGRAGFRVEEYKRPTFEAQLLNPKKPLRFNQDGLIEGEAKYYFGLPVSSGTVKYRVFRHTVYPFWYYWRYFWFASAPKERQVTAGQVPLAADGKFGILFKPEADPKLPDKKSITYSYRIEADVTDEGGETRSASKSYRVGFVAIEAQLTQEENFFLSKQGGIIKALRADLAGVPQAGEAIVQVYRLEQGNKTIWPSERKRTFPEKEFHLPGDSLPPRWEHDVGKEVYFYGFVDGSLIQKAVLTHDAQGWAEFKIPALESGAYRLRYQTKDEYGETYQTQREFIVAGNKEMLRLPIYLMAKKSSVKVGQEAILYFGSGDSGQPYTLTLSKNGKVFRRENAVTGVNMHMLTLPISEDLRGGFTAQIFAIHDHHLSQDRIQVYVPWDNKELKVSFSTFRDRLKPGQDETWTLQVRGPNHEQVTAELLSYMYDKSLDAFVSHAYPLPQSLYPFDYGYSSLRSNLGQTYGYALFANHWYNLPGFPYYGPDYLQYYSNYAIGGPGMRGGGRYLVKSEAVGMMAPKAAMSMEDRVMEGQSRQDLSADKKSKDERSGKTATKAAADISLRSNFSETAFFKPHLLTGKNGKVKIQFKVPDSVTAWKVYVHALTQDLKTMTLVKEAQTAKDLMVRPYLPRFLREGDEAVLKVVVDNTTNRPAAGEVDLDVLDPEKQKSLLKDFLIDGTKRKFQVPAKQSTTVTYKLKAPSRLGTYAFQVTARAGDFSDGELRPLPILPGRVHLIQSKFAILKHDQTKNLELKDLALSKSDPSMIHDSLVVSLEGQLIYSVIKALPYLANYPYECLEQTLNRFLSTAIVTSLYEQYPSIKAIAQEFAKRDTQLNPWSENDPNRKMTLEETPWLQTAKGGSKENLINVLDERIARANKESSLEKIRKAQLPSGAWPWFSGGPASPYITLYLLQGFAKAAEFRVEVPKEMVQKAWRYMGDYYRDYYKGKFVTQDYGYAFITYLNYVLSSFPDASYYEGAFTEADRQEMLGYSFSHWKHHNPYSKALLSMTLMRMKRSSDAQLVMASIMDSARSSEDEGTHWAREDRSWLWYNDTIETHAFILRALMEVDPKNTKNDGLVLWLFLNKKMNQWKSTRTTAEVIYSLVQYLKSIGALEVKEEADVRLAGQSHRYVFEPGSYTGGQNHMVIPGDKVRPEMAKVTVEKKGKGYMFASMTWHYSTEKMPEEGRGDFLSVERTYYLRENVGGRFVLKPLKEGAALKVGDQIEVQLSIRAKHPCEYMHLRDPRAAGLEPERPVSGHHWDLGISWYEEVRDSGANFFFENLPQGEYNFKYRLRANMAGIFKVGPATLQSMYAPEFAAFSAGSYMKIE